MIETARRSSINETLATLVERGMDPGSTERARARIEELP